MTRPFIFIPLLSLSAWGLIGLLAWYAPLTLMGIGGGLFLAVAYDVVVGE
jgi:hypothetical protein